MQIDMHFYGTYALARAAGLPPDVAKTVATAAQFVDDAVDKFPTTVGGDSYIVPVVSSHQMLTFENVYPWDQWQVWVPFHFLPGAAGDNSEEKLLCRPGTTANPAANAILKLAVSALSQPYGWHLLGVVTHVIQDTFSHWGFSGISSDYNHVEQGDITLDASHNHVLLDAISEDSASIWEKVAGSFAEEFSALGHGSVATYPDRPYLRWTFDYEKSLSRCPRHDNKLHIVRNNPEDFMQACERMFGVYVEAAKSLGQPQRDFADISAPVLNILTLEARMAGRIDAWKEAIRTSALFDSTPADTDLRYDDKCWAPASLRTKPKVQKLEAQLYFKAARNYRCFVLGQLLPDLGLL